MGEKTVGIVGRPGDPGDSITYGSVAARLSGLQGTRPFIPPLPPGKKIWFSTRDTR